jgi:hypothetical protein
MRKVPISHSHTLRPRLAMGARMVAGRSEVTMGLSIGWRLAVGGWRLVRTVSPEHSNRQTSILLDLRVAARQDMSFAPPLRPTPNR